MDIFDACAQIRMDAGKQGNKGKKCPGGYWIPQKHKCGGEKKLGSPEASRGSGDDTKRRQRQVVKAGLIAGLGLTGVALAGGAGLLAMKASGGGDAPRPQPPRPSDPEGNAPRPQPPGPTDPGGNAPRSQAEPATETRRGTDKDRERSINFLLDYRRKMHSGTEAFDEAGHRKLAELDYDDNDDVWEVDNFISGLSRDTKSVSKSIRSLEGMGVGNALRQTVAGNLSAYEAEVRKLVAEPLTGTVMEDVRKRQIREAQEVVARHRALLDLFSRKDSLYWDENYTLYM